MKKKIFFYFFTFFFAIQGCSLFPEVEKELIYEYPYHENTICFYYISANATSQNIMQICLLDSRGAMRVIGNYELYNHVVSIDTSINTVRIVLSDTSAHYVPVQDTICLTPELLR